MQTVARDVAGPIPHKALVLIADGRKAIVAQNEGSAIEPKLAVRATLVADENPSNHEQGSDRPGRFGKDGGRRTSAETVDRHELAEQAFLRTAADRFRQMLDEDATCAVVIVAAPAALAVLREALARRSARIVAEVAKDLTKHTMSDIEAMLRQQ